MDAIVRILRGLPTGQEHRAAELFYQAFETKFHVFATREEVLEMLPPAFRREQVLVAVHDKELIGLAGIQHENRSLFRVEILPLVRRFGLASGLVKYLFLRLYQRPYRARELLMDGLCVDPAWRGRGVGTLLLEAVCRFAREHGYNSVRLDVVDTNPGARRLYERLGFTPTHTARYPFTRRLMGFSAATRMVKTLRG